jgi:hypothetical protein
MLLKSARNFLPAKTPRPTAGETWETLMVIFLEISWRKKYFLIFPEILQSRLG